MMEISSLNATSSNNTHTYAASKQLSESGKFTNHKPTQTFSFSTVLGLLKRAILEPKVNTVPTYNFPTIALTKKIIDELPENKTSVVRLGHSTLLVKTNNQLWLLDPVFSERASPFSFMGPKRFHDTPIALEDLPHLHGVIISHNHYDHMDEKTLKTLHAKVNTFLMPIGNAEQLLRWGIPEDKLVELDWWETFETNGLSFTATPSQHFSGRGLSDRNKALWSSWVIQSKETNIFFSGDSGYFDGFKTIGEKFGPFDVTFMENGAYDKNWPDVHMSPSESAKAHLDVKGRKMIPIHNGTFDLAFHQWTDPFEEIIHIANQEWIDVLTPLMGQVITIEDDESVDAARDVYWWREGFQDTSKDKRNETSK